jgi:hypothetical protein
MYSKLCMCEHFYLITNPFKYKYKTCQIFIHPFQKIVASAKWIVDLTFKVNDSIHMQMLIVQKMKKIH